MLVNAPKQKNETKRRRGGLKRKGSKKKKVARASLRNRSDNMLNSA
jgi:hypothetical protein